MNATPAATTAATPGSRPGAAASLTRAAKLAAGHDHAEGTAHPWHRLPAATLRKVRADLRAAFAPGTANQSLAAIRGALRVAWQDGELDHAAYARGVDALKTVPGRAGCSPSHRSGGCSSPRPPIRTGLPGPGTPGCWPSSSAWASGAGKRGRSRRPTSTWAPGRSPSGARLAGTGWPIRAGTGPNRRSGHGWRSGAATTARCSLP